MSDAPAPEPATPIAPMPTAQWEAVKAWMRRELALHAAGLSHEERVRENP